jgi:hypothetical protein
MQKKFNQQSLSAPAGSIVITLNDINTRESIVEWIETKLEYKDPNLSTDSIIMALNGITSDPVFLSQPDHKRTEFIKRKNELVRDLKILK